MPRLLDQSPIPKEVVVRGRRVLLRRNQIVVWVSLTLPRVKTPSPTTLPFPAVLDTGHTHTFAIHEQHLTEWAGIRRDMLAAFGAVRHRGQQVSLYPANIWVHPNLRGVRERLSGETPIQIETNTGIAVYPGSDFPRLPILGLRAVAENDLVLTVDGRRRAATLRTPARWWPFA